MTTKKYNLNVIAIASKVIDAASEKDGWEIIAVHPHEYGSICERCITLDTTVKYKSGDIFNICLSRTDYEVRTLPSDFGIKSCHHLTVVHTFTNEKGEVSQDIAVCKVSTRISQEEGDAIREFMDKMLKFFEFAYTRMNSENAANISWTNIDALTAISASIDQICSSYS